MEPTQEQLHAAFGSNDYQDTEVIYIAVCAAFAAVPDPTELAEKWEMKDAMGYNPTTYYDIAGQLRAFMRGNNK